MIGGGIPRLPARLRAVGAGSPRRSSGQDEDFGPFARHPVLLDLALAVTVAVLAGLSDAFGPDHGSRGAVAWDVLVAVPLLKGSMT